LEEVAYYLGHITKSGMPAIQTTIRFTQVMKEKLKLLWGQHLTIQETHIHRKVWETSDEA
jgi:hypothetical protein